MRELPPAASDPHAFLLLSAFSHDGSKTRSAFGAKDFRAFQLNLAFDPLTEKLTPLGALGGPAQGPDSLT